MTEHHDNTYLKIHRLVTDWLEHERRDEVRQELSSLLEESEEARRLYGEYAQESVGLRWRAVDPPLAFGPTAESASSPDRPAMLRRQLPSSIGWFTVSAAAVVAVAAAATWLFLSAAGPAPAPVASVQRDEAASNAANDAPAEASSRTGTVAATARQPGANEELGTLTRVIEVRWHDEAESLEVFSRIRRGQELRIEQGQAEIVFDSGIELVMEGPSHLKIESPKRSSSEYGTFFARVGSEGIGFTIATPTAKVIDLGTEFGLAVNKRGESEVAVFEGIVDLAYTSDGRWTNPAERWRLTQGEAVRVSRNGKSQRVMSISLDRFPVAGSLWESRNLPPPTIGRVTDNLRDEHSSKFYRVVRAGLREDAQAFVDRLHQWNGLTAAGMPRFLVGADYVMPFNDDKFVRDIEVNVEILRPANVYIFFDDNMDIPEWLSRDFALTDAKIALDVGKTIWDPTATLATGPGNDVGNPLSVWKREIRQPGIVTLGPVQPPHDTGRGYNMYGIAATPLTLDE